MINRILALETIPEGLKGILVSEFEGVEGSLLDESADSLYNRLQGNNDVISWLEDYLLESLEAVEEAIQIFRGE